VERMDIFGGKPNKKEFFSYVSFYRETRGRRIFKGTKKRWPSVEFCSW